MIFLVRRRHMCKNTNSEMIVHDTLAVATGDGLASLLIFF